MKNHKIALLIIFCFAFITSKAQIKQITDASPLNVAYLPDNYAHDWNKHEKAIIKVYYSQPQKKNREIFGSLVPYGKYGEPGQTNLWKLKFFKI